MVRAGLFIALLVFIGSWLYKTPDTPASATMAEAVFGGVSLRVEIVTTTEARARGLSGRSHLADDYGMLFLFDDADTHGIWMKDMLVPIDIFWLDHKRQVIAVQTNVTPNTYPSVFYPNVAAQYVLETSAGFAERHMIATGTVLTLQKS